MKDSEKKPPEVPVTSRKMPDPGVIDALIAQRDALIREMGYIPPDKDQEFWRKPSENGK